MKRKNRWLLPVIALWLAIPGTFIVGLLIMALIPQIGMRVYNLFPSRRRVRETLRSASVDGGINPNWLDAIGFVESRWNPNAVNLTGGDLVRGGSYGATQMSWKTLQAIGYGGTKEQFLASIDEQAKWSVIYLKRGNVQTFADAVAWWNAGRQSFASLPQNHMTRTKYWPKAESALAYVERFSTYVDGASA